MRKTATLAVSLILTISISAGVTAQTSPNSTRANASPAASSTVHELGHASGNIPASNTSGVIQPEKELTPDQAIALLIADLKELRKLHEETKAERDAAVAALEAEKAERQSAERSYSSAEKQIATLNQSIGHLERAIALHEKTIALVEKQRDDAKADAKRSRKVAIVSALITAAKVFGIF